MCIVRNREKKRTTLTIKGLSFVVIFIFICVVDSLLCVLFYLISYASYTLL